MMRYPECWCANKELVTFSPDYLKCPICESLVLAHWPTSKTFQVENDEQDFYGRGYYEKHLIESYDYPGLTERARSDLPERCLHWLRTLLKYKLPPARILELGSAHGGFVAVLRQAGFDATGLELSPWIVKFARKAFDIPMLLGPIENQQIESSSLDVIALMDVLEHLPDPVGTMSRCLELLKPDGVILLQTPRYPEGKSYQEMTSQHDRFLVQLKEKEHLYLFSQRSIQEFFHKLGADHLVFEPAIFAHYDMFVVVGRAPLAVYLPEEIVKSLSAIPSSRMIQALLDLDDQFLDLQKRYTESEADRAARLEQVHTLTAQLRESEADRAARLEQVHTLTAQLRESEADRAARLEENQVLRRRADELETESNILQEQLNIARLAAEGLRASRAYKLLRKLGRWEWLAQMFEQAFPSLEGSATPQLEDNQQTSFGDTPGKKTARIAVDLTPLLPGGDNGGAKLVAMGLIQQLSRIAPDWEFMLLTSDKSHDELAILDASNVHRLCVAHHNAPGTSPANRSPRLRRLRIRVQEGLARLLPAPLFAKLKSLYRSLHYHAPTRNILKEIGLDLLFCPFTAPFFFDPAVPMVSVIHDIQYRYYPQFFSPEERQYRDQHFKEACQLAARLICVSEHTRRTVLENTDLSPDHVAAIHTQLFHQFDRPSSLQVGRVLDRLGLSKGGFLLYPSNFWPHKNHRMLLTALGIYRDRHPQSDLKLVCTGAPDLRMRRLQEAARQMRLGEYILFPGYLPAGEFAALLSSCRALIFPSLYEGFGMPILEAMAFDRPVLCSNVTSLPEVAGEAALFFDPRKPAEMVSVIERIENDPELGEDLVQRGRARLKTFDDASAMARRYLQIFQEVMSNPSYTTPALHGVYPDGWTGKRMVITYGTNPEPRDLEMTLNTPSWLPYERVLVTVTQDRQAGPKIYPLARDQVVTIRQALAYQGGFIELVINPVFQPKAYGMGEDERTLGCLCQACQIVSLKGKTDLLQGLIEHDT